MTLQILGKKPVFFYGNVNRQAFVDMLNYVVIDEMDQIFTMKYFNLIDENQFENNVCWYQGGVPYRVKIVTARLQSFLETR